MNLIDPAEVNLFSRLDIIKDMIVDNTSKLSFRSARRTTDIRPFETLRLADIVIEHRADRDSTGPVTGVSHTTPSPTTPPNQEEDQTSSADDSDDEGADKAFRSIRKPRHGYYY